jgi:hypothetical protein
MTTYTYPDGRAYLPQQMEWGMQPLVRRANSVMSGASYVLQRPGGLWTVSLQYPAQRQSERAAIEGLMFALAGGAHKLELWDLSRPSPLGTIGTSGVTAQAAAQFAESITLNASGTIKAGDKFKIGTQLFMCIQDASGSGSIVVPVRHMVRAAISAGAAVTLIKPTTTFIPVSDSWSSPRAPGGWCPPVSIDLVEAP